MKRSWLILSIGLGMGALLILMKFLETRFFLGGISLELYLAVIGLVFLGIGWWLGRKKPNEAEAASPLVNKLPPVADNPLSEREMEVLREISAGYSNQQIADRLHVSLNTVKSHAKNIYLKLEVNRRTQAVSRAKELGLLE